MASNKGRKQHGQSHQTRVNLDPTNSSSRKQHIQRLGHHLPEQTVGLLANTPQPRLALLLSLGNHTLETLPLLLELVRLTQFFLLRLLLFLLRRSNGLLSSAVTAPGLRNGPRSKQLEHLDARAQHRRVQSGEPKDHGVAVQAVRPLGPKHAHALDAQHVQRCGRLQAAVDAEEGQAQNVQPGLEALVLRRGVRGPPGLEEVEEAEQPDEAPRDVEAAAELRDTGTQSRQARG